MSLTIYLENGSFELSDAQLQNLAQALQPFLTLAPLNPTVHQQPAPGAPQASPAPVPAVQQDPWAPQNGQPANGYAQQSATPAQPQQQYQAAPNCQHGVMRFVPSGFSKSSGKPYPAFYGCSAQQNDPSKCRSVPA